jgi:hypothetical protein
MKYEEYVHDMACQTHATQADQEHGFPLGVYSFGQDRRR